VTTEQKEGGTAILAQIMADSGLDQLIRLPTEEEATRLGWIAYDEEGRIIPARMIILRNEAIGATLGYGYRNDGYDGLAFRQRGGGGSVIMPYAIIAGELFVGTVVQNRILQGGPVPNLPRGMLAAGETHFEGAAREGTEELAEAGVTASEIAIPHALTGVGWNPDSAFLATQNPGEGVHFFGMRIAEAALKRNDNGTFSWGSGYKPLEGDRVAEGITKCVFMPWQQFIHKGDGENPNRARDGFTAIAVALVMDHLIREGHLSLSFS
jgi:hypothetical protein